ncbi:MAG TPA: VWA domain-containing protein [Jatrophihabitans sp.]|jgi:hypothetical protein
MPAAIDAEPGILDRHVAFIAALREAGLAVSVAESIDAAGAFGEVDLLHRESLRAAYAATVVKRQIHRAVFDALFDLYYPALSGDGIAAEQSSGAAEAANAPVPTSNKWDVNDPTRLRLRDDLADYLSTGDEPTGTAVARTAVAAFPVPSVTGTGRLNWSRQYVMERLSPQTLFAELIAALLDGASDATSEAIARATLDRRLERFVAMVENEVRRRVAERDGVERTAPNAKKSIDSIPLISATKKELEEIRREIQPLARRLAARLKQKQRRGSSGQLDMRHTIRESLSTGGVPVNVRYKPKRPRRMDLVVICDVSGSVAAFAHFTLLLVYALREQFTRVRTFAFVDEIDEVTGFFAPGGDPAEAVRLMGEKAKVTGVNGRTDYGVALTHFEDRWADALGRRTTLLILGDARTNYGRTEIPTLQAMVSRAHRAYWLNPEYNRMWDVGDSVAAKYAEVLPMVECRNLAQLAAFVRDLADD